jgi:hypothetical protein
VTSADVVGAFVFSGLTPCGGPGVGTDILLTRRSVLFAAVRLSLAHHNLVPFRSRHPEFLGGSDHRFVLIVSLDETEILVLGTKLHTPTIHASIPDADTFGTDGGSPVIVDARRLVAGGITGERRPADMQPRPPRNRPRSVALPPATLGAAMSRLFQRLCPACPNVMRIVVVVPADERRGECRTYVCEICGHKETILFPAKP